MIEAGHFEKGAWIDDPMPDPKKYKIIYDTLFYTGDFPLYVPDAEVTIELKKNLNPFGTRGELIEVNTISRIDKYVEDKGLVSQISLRAVFMRIILRK